MTANDDRDLRERFVALREADATDVPPLSRMLRNRETRPSAHHPRSIPVAVLVTAAAVAAAVLVLKPHDSVPSIDEAITEAQSMSSWVAPTDEWLALAGLEIPNSVPSISLSSVTLPEEPLGSTSPPATPQGEIQ